MSKVFSREMPVVAIDGPAGSGKSTIAKMLAKDFRLYQIDSGALYRSYTYYALQFAKQKKISSLSSGIIDTVEFGAFVKNIDFEIKFENNMQIIMVNEKNMEEFIREPVISENIKSVADNRLIRDLVNEALKKIERKYPIVADGRDMGTVVYPDADIKFFITASLKERAKRRYKEFTQKHPGITLEAVEDQISIRDKDDENRPYGALKQAKDSIFVDTTSKDLDGVYKEVVKNFRESSSKRIRNFIESLEKS
ncbi:MAG: (d)CMP kinase [Spirochaetia bacterium]|nr:(d)CMP kinase [Spirochaetia bacterium]